MKKPIEKTSLSVWNIPGTGLIISVATTILTVITFAIAFNTPPLSGPFCTGECFEYPYHNIINRFPRDYYWMFPAIVLSFFYLFLMIIVHYQVPEDRKHFSLMAVSLAIMSTTILALDYFIQVSFIQPSLLAGETEGIAMLSQFNPHGIFIILEELGFSLMILSFLMLTPVFSRSGFPGKILKIVFVTAFVMMAVSFAAIAWTNGINREYRYEVAIISIAWTELIIVGILLSFYFRGLDKNKQR
jgi:hypothetical protein